MKAAILKGAATLSLFAAVAASTAQAQDQSSTPVDGNVAGASKPATKSGTVILNTNSPVPLTTSTASLPAAVQAKKSNFGGEFYSETSIPMADFERGRGKAVLNSYGGLRYDLGNTNAIAVRQNFDFLSNSSSGGGNFKIQDTVVNFTRGKLAELKDGTTLTLIARAYLPTGENSRNIGQHGQERLYLIASKSIGKLDLTFITMARAFQQSRSYNVNDEGKFAQTTKASLTNEFDAFFNITKQVALGMIVGMDNVARNRAPGLSTSHDDVYVQPTLQVAPLKGLTMQAYLYNELNIRAPSQEHRLFRGGETSVAFNVAAQL